jgi:hypothetical protein
MKKHFLKIFFITALLGVYSCSLNDDSHNDETIIDYNTFGYNDKWIESQKINQTDTVTLDNVELSFFYNENEIPRAGEYRYINRGELTEIDTTGIFIQDSVFLYFISNNNSFTYNSENILENLSGEADVYKYRIENEHLILTDTTAPANFELLYNMENN